MEGSLLSLYFKFLNPDQVSKEDVINLAPRLGDREVVKMFTPLFTPLLIPHLFQRPFFPMYRNALMVITSKFHLPLEVYSIMPNEKEERSSPILLEKSQSILSKPPSFSPSPLSPSSSLEKFASKVSFGKTSPFTSENNEIFGQQCSF